MCVYRVFLTNIYVIVKARFNVLWFVIYIVKEKEDAHQDPEIQPMKEDDGTFGEYRWDLLNVRVLNW